MRIISVAIIALAVASSASAQLIVTSQGPTPLALAIQAGGGFNYTPSTIPVSFVSAGRTFTTVANLADFVVGNGVTIDMSYISKESGHTNWVGVTSGSFDDPLYAPYSASSASVGYHFDAPVPTTLSMALWHSDRSDNPAKVWQSDPSVARFWEYTESDGTKDYILGWDDRYPDLDKDDGTFLIQVRQSAAVPEASTYGLVGAVALLGIVALRRKKAILST